VTAQVAPVPAALIPESPVPFPPFSVPVTMTPVPPWLTFSRSVTVFPWTACSTRFGAVTTANWNWPCRSPASIGCGDWKTCRTTLVLHSFSTAENAPIPWAMSVERVTPGAKAAMVTVDGAWQPDEDPAAVPVDPDVDPEEDDDELHAVTASAAAPARATVRASGLRATVPPSCLLVMRADFMAELLLVTAAGVPTA
jgi:hypothetical protein